MSAYRAHTGVCSSYQQPYGLVIMLGLLMMHQGQRSWKYFPKSQVKYVAELGIESPGMSDSKSQYLMLPLY